MYSFKNTHLKPFIDNENYFLTLRLRYIIFLKFFFLIGLGIQDK